MLFRQQKSVNFLISPKHRKFSKWVNPWFLAKNDHFSHLQFFSKSSQERSFFDILDREECFLDKKRQLFKTPRNRNPQFLPKMAIFLNGGFLAYPARKHAFLIFWIEKNVF